MSGNTRKGKERNYEHLEKQLKDILTIYYDSLLQSHQQLNNNTFIIYLDGELYNHQYKFEQIQSCVKKEKNFSQNDIKLLKNLNYHVYDCIIALPKFICTMDYNCTF